MGVSIPKQAAKQGAKVFVHYSFPRHMSIVLLAARRDLMKQTCEEIGIEFVDATAPDPTGDAGLSGAQQFILEDVPKMVEKYGKDTAFFSTNCAMQIPLIKAAYEEGAIYPQPCCPSPYHGFPAALGAKRNRSDHKNNRGCRFRRTLLNMARTCFNHEHNRKYKIRDKVDKRRDKRQS